MHHCHPELAPLCRLINDSLSPLIVSLSPLTKEKEKDLLIVLSQILREIRGWEDEELDGDFELVPHMDNFHDCFAHIVCLLVSFLDIESQYVRHLSSNVLVGISDYLSESERKWDRYLLLLCLCLEVSISNILSSTSGPLVTGTTEQESDSRRLILYVWKKMRNANWYTLVGIVRVLRTIAKNLKQCSGGELLEIYMNNVRNCITNIPWDLLNGIHVAQDCESQIGSIIKFSWKFGSPVTRFVFLGALLQLFCSLVHQSSSIQVATSNEHPVIKEITSIVPKLLDLCCYKHEDDIWKSSSQYLKHKMLMLMIRLSFQVQQELSVLVLWLQLLHKYFQDLLHQPISESHADLDNCLEGSPFLLCLADGQKVHRMHISHLHRRAVFLFLKCSINLISLCSEFVTKCSCATPNSFTTYELQSSQECCTRKMGLMELSEWLNWHVPVDMFVDYELYLENCGRFTSSFLQLYMDEDDFLFEVLLHLSTLPLPVQQMDYKNNEKAFKELKGDIMFHLSNIFNPVYLFHLFLAKLQYDHSVLLDYLISKDAGIHCLQYLLRCLRTVSNSWNLFLEFPVCGTETIRSSCKKRKLSVYGSAFNGKVELPSATEKWNWYPGIFDSRSKTNSKCGSMLSDPRQRTFQNAKECLFSLKSSVENLHQKNLFPYNPTVLLRSFTRFQELCHRQGRRES